MLTCEDLTAWAGAGNVTRADPADVASWRIPDHQKCQVCNGPSASSRTPERSTTSCPMGKPGRHVSQSPLLNDPDEHEDSEMLDFAWLTTRKEMSLNI